MEQSDKYFVIQDAKEVEGGKLQVVGQFIVDGSVTFHSKEKRSKRPSSDESQEPPYDIKIPEPFEVKYILPSKNNPFYGLLKAAAEAVGHETVDQDDFSYPENK